MGKGSALVRDEDMLLTDARYTSSKYDVNCLEDLEIWICAANCALVYWPEDVGCCTHVIYCEAEVTPGRHSSARGHRGPYPVPSARGGGEVRPLDPTNFGMIAAQLAIWGQPR